MKKSIIAIAAVAIAMVSCKKTETTAADVGANPDAKVVVVKNDSLPITNDSTANAVNNAAEHAKDATGNAIKNGAADVKDAANKATDGDGKLTK